MDIKICLKKRNENGYKYFIDYRNNEKAIQ